MLGSRSQQPERAVPELAGTAARSEAGFAELLDRSAFSRPDSASGQPRGPSPAAGALAGR